MTGFVAATPIIKPYCNSGAQVAPPIGTSTTVANQEIGFPPLQATPLNAGGIPVDIEQFNGVLNFYSAQILNNVAGVPITFDADFSTQYNGYPSGIILHCASNNSYQISLVNNNTANFIINPAYINDGVNWRCFQTISILNTGNIFLYNNADVTHYALLTYEGTGVSNYIWPSIDPPTNDLSLLCTTSGVMSWGKPLKILSVNYIGTNTISSASNIVCNTYYINTMGGTPYNTSTGVFTCPITGMYEINSIFVGLLSSGTGEVEAQLFVNGVSMTVLGDSYFTVASPVINCTGTVTLNLNAGDLITIQFYNSFGSTVNYGTSVTTRGNNQVQFTIKYGF